MPRSAILLLPAFLALVAWSADFAPAGAPDRPDGPDFREAWAAAEARELSSEHRQALLGRLVAGGDRVVRFLRSQLVVEVDADRVAALIDQLDHRDFRVRERATRQLATMGPGVAPLARAHMTRARDAEVRARLQAVLAELESGGADPARWARAAVAVEALGQIGSEPARELLADLAARWSGSRQALARAKHRCLLKRHLGLHGDRSIDAAVRGESSAAQSHLVAARRLAADQALARDPEARLLLARAVRLKQLAERIARDAGKPGLSAADRVARARDCLVYLGRPAVGLKILPDGADARLRAVLAAAARSEAGSRQDAARVAEYLAAIQRDPDAVLSRERLLRAGRWFTRAAGWAGEDRAEMLQRASRQAVAAEKLAGKLTGWRNLLVGIRPRGHLRQGNWKLVEGAWHVEQGDFALAEIPGEIPGDYVLQVELTRKAGKDGIYIGFPVGSESLNLNLSGWEGKATGLEMIGGQQAISGPAHVKPGKLTNDVKHTLLIEVDLADKRATITVRLDGQEILRHVGDPKIMAAARHVWDRKDLSAVAIGAHRCQVLFHSIRIGQPRPEPSARPGPAAREDQ